MKFKINVLKRRSFHALNSMQMSKKKKKIVSTHLFCFCFLSFAIRLGHHNSLRQLLWAHGVHTPRVVTARDLFTSSVVLLRPPGIRYRSAGRLGQRLNVPTQGRRVARTFALSSAHEKSGFETGLSGIC